MHKWPKSPPDPSFHTLDVSRTVYQFPSLLSSTMSRHLVGLWTVTFLMGAIPLVVGHLIPLWRVMAWLSPTLLALDVDAGNRRSIYIAKAVVWVLFTAFTQFMLWDSSGFTAESTYVQRSWAAPITCLFFITSCALTVIGNRYKRINWVGPQVTSKFSVPDHLRAIDSTVYADFANIQIKTDLKLHELKGAWFPDPDAKDGRRDLTPGQVTALVLRTSFVTQFVMSRIFKSANNRVFVYSTVTRYRSTILFVSLAVAGCFHVMEGLFAAKVQRDIIGSMILWLTLPTITVPALLKTKFGNEASIGDMWRGLLPVYTDEQLWRRLNVSATDLYTALTNATTAERLLREQIGLLQRPGVGTVITKDLDQARRLCAASLLRIGDLLVRLSDGRRFVSYGPGDVKVLDKDWDEIRAQYGSHVPPSAGPICPAGANCPARRVASHRTGNADRAVAAGIPQPLALDGVTTAETEAKESAIDGAAEVRLPIDPAHNIGQRSPDAFDDQHGSWTDGFFVTQGGVLQPPELSTADSLEEQKPSGRRKWWSWSG